MKKLLLLGGSRYLIPVIKTAHKLGLYVITCDYLPENIAHKYSNEFHNVSIIDEEAVLNLAIKLKIDGIMSFATDPGVVTASFVAEKLGLPTNPYESVKILQNKALFRGFLRDNGFEVPKAAQYQSYDKALSDIEQFNFPIIVKPVDSAGSKGVFKVDSPEMLEQCFVSSSNCSKSKSVIIEEYIDVLGYSSDSDCFSVDGKLLFSTFSAQYFDEKAINPFVPSGYIWPTSMPFEFQSTLKDELQRLIHLLNLNTSLYNVETRVGKNGKAYIMEVSPRGGGNRIAEILQYACNVDLISSSIQAAIGNKIDEIDKEIKYNGYWAEVIVHSNKAGIFKGIFIDPEIESKFVFKKDLWKQKGDMVNLFTGANEALGTIILHNSNRDCLERVMQNIHQFIKVIVE